MKKGTGPPPRAQGPKRALGPVSLGPQHGPWGPTPACGFHKIKKSRPGGGLRSRIRSQNGSFYLFYLGVEVLNQAPRRLILLLTFLPGVGMRSTIRPQDGSFYLFTFLPGGGLRSRFKFQDVLLPVELFPILRGVV